ncbi:hypothetical protein ACFV9C_42445 [Kribbella sp. NPDC059898]|uniref:hypothetical protein n=1 Tax=Kribbella sp. NPDC059898 TaxID=3346995 RepID=UPI003654D987
MALNLYVIKRTAPDYEQDDLAVVAAEDENIARLFAGRASSKDYAFDWCDPAASDCIHAGTALDTFTEPQVIRLGKAL